jgi:hypothetical protein
MGGSAATPDNVDFSKKTAAVSGGPRRSEKPARPVLGFAVRIFKAFGVAERRGPCRLIPP